MQLDSSDIQQISNIYFQKLFGDFTIFDSFLQIQWIHRKCKSRGHELCFFSRHRRGSRTFFDIWKVRVVEIWSCTRNLATGSNIQRGEISSCVVPPAVFMLLLYLYNKSYNVTSSSANENRVFFFWAEEIEVFTASEEILRCFDPPKVHLKCACENKKNKLKKKYPFDE